jgi:hypothetical protein
MRVRRIFLLTLSSNLLLTASHDARTPRSGAYDMGANDY